ncbi:MAG: 50S ribosomal protein L10 [Fuerstiella sp.]
MSRQIKDMLIEDLQQKIGDAKDMVVVDCSKLDAISANQWRLGMQEKNIQALTVKNSIARNALSRAGVTGLDEILAGPSTLVWGGEDVVDLSKEISRWAKELGKLEIKGATVEGGSLDASAVEALSKSPGRAELIGQIAGLFLAPGAQLAGAMQGPGGQLAGCFESVSEESE